MKAAGVRVHCVCCFRCVEIVWKTWNEQAVGYKARDKTKSSTRTLLNDATLKACNGSFRTGNPAAAYLLSPLRLILGPSTPLSSPQRYSEDLPAPVGAYLFAGAIKTRLVSFTLSKRLHMSVEPLKSAEAALSQYDGRECSKNRSYPFGLA